MINKSSIINDAAKRISSSYQYHPNEISGFPEILNRDRVTEWGGTVSAIRISELVPNYFKSETIEKSIAGILNTQNSQTSAWGASGVDLVEATSEIISCLFDIKDKYPALNINEHIDKAVDFVKSRYDKEIGCFHSNAFSGGKEHTIYSTFKAVTALIKIGALSAHEKWKITLWLKDAIGDNDLWGESQHASQYSITHSLYALLTLYSLDVDIKTDYKNQLNFLFNQINQSGKTYDYEEYSINTSESDENGRKYKRVRINHFILPLAITLFVKVGDMAKAKILEKQLLKINYGGAWGLYDTFCTTWATQQAIDSIVLYNQKRLRLSDYFNYCWLWIKANKLFVVILILLIIVVLIILKKEGVVAFVCNAIVSIVLGIAANKITG